MVRKQSTVDKLAKLRNKLANTDMKSGGGGGFFYPKEGSSVIRIMPETGEMEVFFQPVGRHHFGKEQDAKKVYCPNYTSEGELPCPICEARELLYNRGKQGDTGATELSKMLSVRRSFWMNVIDRSDEAAGPKIYTPGVTVMNGISSLVMDPDYGDISDQLEGTDITIERTGTGLDTEYSVVPKRLVSPLHESDDKAIGWSETARDLSFVELSDDPSEDAQISAGHAVFVLSYDRLQAEFDEFFGLADDEDYEEEKEPVKKAAPRKRRVTVTKDDPTPSKVEVEEVEVEEVEVEEVEVEEVEDEVEKELKVRKRRRRRVRQ